MKYSLIFLPLLLFQSCHAQPVREIKSNVDDNTLLWEISGNGLPAPSYLFGTFHLMCKEDINLSENLKQVLKDSKELYLEMDMDDPANTLGAMFYINMKDGKTLKDLYTPDEYSRVERFFKDSLKTGLAMLQRMKPNFLQALVYPKMMPCKTMSGMEEAIMQLAKKDNKEIKGFETIAFQASVFDSIPYEEQAKELLNMLDSLPVYTHYFDTMLHVYKTQQMSAMQTMFDDPQFNMDQKDQDILLDKRNADWVQQLKAILPKTNIFIAVGAGHLIGEKGLISLLRREGFTLRPIANK